MGHMTPACQPWLSDQARPANKTGETEKKTKVGVNLVIEEGRGERATGNLYLPFPSNIPLTAAGEGEEEYSYISYDFEQ